MCLASELGIETRWLPVACPELNPVDHLWRHVKQDVLANEPTPDLDTSVGYACQYIFGLTPQQRLRKAGVLSDTLTDGESLIFEIKSYAEEEDVERFNDKAELAKKKLNLKRAKKAIITLEKHPSFVRFCEQMGIEAG